MNYTTELPTAEYIRETMQSALEMWKGRNEFIYKVREMLEGSNVIEAPRATQYKVQTMHTYMLTGIINEKLSRFSHLPSIQVIPNWDDNSFDEARSRSTSIELAYRSAQYEMERNGDGDVWNKVMLDAIVLDMGVERIERAPSAFWPEIGRMETAEAIENYKKEKGFPMRSLYVPLENFFPIYEGPTLVESFEVDYRSLRSILRNPLFSNRAGALASLADSTNMRARLDIKVPVVMHCNADYFSYWALMPGVSSYYSVTESTQFSQRPETISSAHPIMLHSYQHNLGRSMYNTVPGRFGGWKGSNNRVEGVTKGLLDLNQKADEITSQVLTNIRARYWPTLIHKVDYERRGVAAGSNPKPLTVPEGQDIAIFKDESVEPIFKAEHDEAVVWLFDEIRSQIARLGGSATLFGTKEPGVDTGYHQALQITQAEHLDEKIEQSLVQGAIQRATLIALHIRAMNERGNNIGKVYTNYIENVKGKGKARRYISFDPQDFYPMPVFDARVRKPRPVDFVASLRAAVTATDERGGKGALLSDDTARSEILGREDSDVEERKVLVESQKRQLAGSGALTARILQMLNLGLASEGAEAPTGQVDPVLAAIASGTGQGAPTPQGSGGLREGQGGGMPTGQSQPEANLGQEQSLLSGVLNA